MNINPKQIETILRASVQIVTGLATAATAFMAMVEPENNLGIIDLRARNEDM